MNRLLIRRPIISEKATAVSSAGKYIFLVHPSVNKKQVKELIEKIYKVHLVGINVVRIKSKSQNYKKAIVTLKEGESIDIIPK